jgi:hypothetical protein
MPALCPDPVGDDAGEDQDHPEEDDEVGRVLGQRERPDHGVVHVRDERVLVDVREQTEHDHERTDLRETRHGPAA